MTFPEKVRLSDAMARVSLRYLRLKGFLAGLYYPYVWGLCFVAVVAVENEAKKGGN
jgi:hypothetical protein